MYSKARSESAETLIEAYRAAARERPGAELLVSSEAGLARITLAKTLKQGATVAQGLRDLGLRAGDVLAVQMPQRLELAVCFAAAAQIGAILLPIVPAFGPTELGFILRESGARILVTPDRWRRADCRQRLLDCGSLPDLIAHVVIGETPDGAVAWDNVASVAGASDAAGPDQPGVSFLYYTSGTTSDPKGAEHTDTSMLWEIRSTEALMGKSAEGVTMTPWPAGHIAGALMILRFLIAGRTMILMDHWDPKVAADLMQHHRASFGCGTPFHLTGLLDAADAAGHDLVNLKSFQTGAAPVPPTLIARCAERGVATYRSYGSTEHPTSTWGSLSDPLEKRLTTEGRIVPGCEVRTVDEAGRFLPKGAEGELVTRGPDMFRGYRRAELNAAAFVADGWYRTGDVGYMDADGYLILTDRKKDIIIRGGENISSREVEDHLLAHPAVKEVAAIAAPDARMGEIVCVFLVPREGARIDLAEIGRWFAERGLARHKTPERLELIDELPRNATGKVVKPELRRRLKSLLAVA